MKSEVQFKGIREGLLVTFHGGDWLEMRSRLVEHINQQAEFLRGGNLALDVQSQELDVEELSNLKDEISTTGLSLWAVLSESTRTTKSAQSLGLATRLAKITPAQSSEFIETQKIDGEDAVCLRRTLRSGNKIQYAGHVVIIGDVNPGAEIIAKGNVIVWGRLRGVVHAGADGDEKAVICALDLSPTQLRIAGMIALAPQRRGRPQPEIARIVDDQVVAEAWNQK